MQISNLNELEETLLDIEVNLNNHLLTYLEDDVAFPVVTPNSLIFGQPTTLRALRERHNMKHKVKKMKIPIGDVALIKNEDRNRRK